MGQKFWPLVRADVAILCTVSETFSETFFDDCNKSKPDW